MTFKVFVLRDTESKDYGKPLLFENDALAVRYLHSLIESQQLNKYADRFYLKCIAWYDSEKGDFSVKENYALDWVGEIVPTNEVDDKLKFIGKDYVQTNN